MLALHTGLEEFWFGWRAQKIFTEPQGLCDYCRNTASSLDLLRVARQQDVRYWIAGQVEPGAVPGMRLQLTDADGTPQQREVGFAVAPEDGLVTLRPGFLEWLAACGLPLLREQIDKTLWCEETNSVGMQRLGEALEVFYGNGYAAAAEAFSVALVKNPHGAGVISGLMRYAVEVGDEEGAYRWAEAIANLRGGDAAAQKAAAAHLLAKTARSRGEHRDAAALYRKATDWDPTNKLYADGLTAALEASAPATGRAHPSRIDR